MTRVEDGDSLTARAATSGRLTLSDDYGWSSL
jgi:hypothetical protein